MTRVFRLLLTVVFAAVIPLATPGVAQAHEVTAWIQPSCCGVLGYARLSADHYSVMVCDSKADGRGVRVYYEYHDASWSHFWSGVRGDANGAQSGCGVANTYPYKIWWINACAGVDGANTYCSGGKYDTT